MNLDDRELRIDYPCEWVYKVIGRNEGELHLAVKEMLDGHTYVMNVSNTSSNGRYCSLNVRLTVTSDEERHNLYHRLVTHRAVKIVL